MSTAQRISSEIKYEHIVKYTLLTSLIVFVIHTVMSFLVKQAVKTAILSEAIGIAAALTAVSVIMLILYFSGRKYIKEKNLMPVRMYRLLSAELPVVIWLIVLIFRVSSAISGLTDNNTEISLETILNMLKSMMQLVNSVTGLISSLMVLVSAGICELAGIIKKMIVKKAENK